MNGPGGGKLNAIHLTVKCAPGLEYYTSVVELDIELGDS